MTKKLSSEESKARDKKFSKSLHDSMQFDEILNQNEKQYRDILSGIEDGYYEVDIAGNLSFFNDSLCKIYGYARDELIGMNNREYMTSATAEKAYLVFNRVYKTGEPSKIFDWEFLKKDGTKIDVEISVSIIKNSKGEAIGFRGIVRDIGERKRIEATLKKSHAELERRVKERTRDLIKINKRLEQEITERKFTEEALRESEEKYRLFADNVSDVIWTMDMEQRFTYVSPSIQKLLGYTQEEALQISLERVLAPESYNKTVSVMIEEIDSEGEPGVLFDRSRILELEQIRKDGSLVWVELTTSFVRGKGGLPSGIIGISRDITERKQYQDQLIDSKKEWENIFQSIGQPTIILDPEHGIAKANKAILNLTGCTEGQLIGKKCFEIFHTTAKPPESCPVKALLRKGVLETVEMEMEAFDGTFLVSCTPINDKDGNLEKIIHIATDITKTKKLEAELRQARKMESISTLAGGVAHDFNNILYTITGNAELALEDIPEWNPVHDTLEEIKAAGLRAAGIVKQLFNFSRKVDQDLRPIGAITVINEALKFLRSTIPSTIEIRKHLPESDVIIFADPIQINQILMNLCTNAAQAMENTGGILEITVENELLPKDAVVGHLDLKAGEYVKITVKDTGPGINPEVIEQIFDPYFTTKEFGKGSGMGLSIVLGIVKNHSGAITVDSQPGKGTTFTMLFPAVAEQTVEAVKTPDEVPCGHETILFVDDEEPIVKMIGQMLGRLGYRVETRQNPAEALKLFQSKPHEFNLVITDMTMPQMTGVTLSEKLKDIRSDIPIIICTGHSAFVDEKTAKKMGVSAYVMKPIMKKDIAKIIRQVLDNPESSGKG